MGRSWDFAVSISHRGISAARLACVGGGESSDKQTIASQNHPETDLCLLSANHLKKGEVVWIGGLFLN